MDEAFFWRFIIILCGIVGVSMVLNWSGYLIDWFRRRQK